MVYTGSNVFRNQVCQFHTFQLRKRILKSLLVVTKQFYLANKHLVNISLPTRYQSQKSLCKSQVLENAYHLFYSVLAGPNGNALSEPSVDTHANSLSLFTIPLISSSRFHTDCQCSQAGSSTMTSASQMELKGRLEFPKGRRKWRVYTCI